jgi:hypothetical protein
VAPVGTRTQIPGIWAGTGWGDGGVVSPDGRWTWTGEQWARRVPAWVPVTSVLGGVLLVVGALLYAAAVEQRDADRHVPPGWVGHQASWPGPFQILGGCLVAVGLVALVVSVVVLIRVRRDHSPASVC